MISASPQGIRSGGAWYRHIIVDETGEVAESPCRDVQQGRRRLASLRAAGRAVWLLSPEEAKIYAARGLENEDEAVAPLPAGY